MTNVFSSSAAALSVKEFAQRMTTLARELLGPTHSVVAVQDGMWGKFEYEIVNRKENGERGSLGIFPKSRIEQAIRKLTP